jgi:hypothetical protein
MVSGSRADLLLIHLVDSSKENRVSRHDHGVAVLSLAFSAAETIRSIKSALDYKALPLRQFFGVFVLPQRFQFDISMKPLQVKKLDPKRRQQLFYCRYLKEAGLNWPQALF